MQRTAQASFCFPVGSGQSKFQSARWLTQISCLCSAAALAVYFEVCMAVTGGADATETGNELSQPKFELTSLFLIARW